MSAPSSNGGHGCSGRRCQGCGSALAADNTARLCSKCHRELRDQLRTPPAHLRNEFFETLEFLAAFESQHIGKVFKVFRNHPHFLRLYGKALNQEVLGRWLGLTQAQVSKLENGKPERNLDNLINYARALHLPEHLLWFKFPGQKLRMPQSPSTAQVITAPNGLVVSQPPDELLVANTGMDTLELLRRVRSSAINAATIDALDITVKQLCCDYSHADAGALMKQGQQWLNNMIGLLDKRLTLAALWATPGGLTDTEWKHARATLDENERDLRRELAELPPSVINVDIAGARAAWPDMTLDEKREFIRLFITKVTIRKAVPGRPRVFDPERLEIEWRTFRTV